MLVNPTIQRMTEVLKLAYRKHCCDDDNIGWEELEEQLTDVMQEITNEEELELRNLELKVGDTVKIVNTTETPIFSIGHLATLLEIDDEGDWLADFNNNGNDTVSQDGIWHLEKGYTVYELVS